MSVTSMPGILLVLILTLPGAYMISAVEQNDFPITLAPLDQIYAAIYGTIVVWQDNRNGDWDIYAYDLSAKEEFPISTDAGDQKYPAIYGNIVVWRDSGDESRAKTLCSYDLLTGKKTVVPTVADVEHVPVIYGDTVVWEGYLDSKECIIAHNLSTDEESFIPVSSYVDGDPAISGDIAVWSEKKRGGLSIQAFDLQERKRISTFSTLITFSPDEDQINPEIYHDVIVWTERRVIHALNLRTRKETRIAETEAHYSFFDEGNLAVYKDVIVWRDRGTDGENIFGYDLSAKKGFQITSEGSEKGFPEIYGDLVVWQDKRNGDWDIYGFDLTSPVIPLEVSRKNFILSDLLVIGFILGPLVYFFLLTQRLRADMEKSKRIMESKPTQKKFKRTSRSEELGNLLLNLSSFLFFGFLAIIWQGDSFGYLYFLYFFYMAIYGIFYYKWLSKTPYILMDDKELTIFRKPHFKPTVTLLSTIKKVNVEIWTGIPSKIKLLLTDDNHAEINLSSLATEDRKQFIQTLVEIVREK
ncbi:MAG: hypothetical protein HXS52_04950 [Theionarchaea archaeon]|nr:hypothetical protein [Theionarchaea archaeon]MBU7037255.1 hypothetical protein [Theionarchaea archaeon]